MENNEYQLRSTEEIPSPYRNIFSEFPCFNLMQSQVLDEVLHTDNSIVISSPTGSGKTTIFELAIVRILMQYEGTNFLEKFKIIYISPIKALCQEKINEWHKKFTSFRLSMICITGDSDKIEFRALLNYNLIISTPEKWDALTRKWRDNEELVKVVKLFMIDEVHLLNADTRGSTLEVIVSRMKTVEINQQIRFIAASATVPNVEDIADWIGHSVAKNSKTKYFKFSEDMRPVKLKKIVHGYPFYSKTQTTFKFDIYLNFRLQPLIKQYSEGKPTLIFCNTRKSVEMTARSIVQHLKINLTAEQKQKLLDVAAKVSDKALRDILVHGFAFHHAGLLQENRHTIEDCFKRGELPVLVTTSALALGVNLPAHLVIIKNTKQYVPGLGVRDYDEIEIFQMIGRAGRPQYDTSATAIILTTNEDKPKFEKMVSCQQPIESNLHKHLTEHLNAEVVLRTITDLDVAMKWLASTFLYIRARKNPHHYSLPIGLDADHIDKKIFEIFQIHLNKLVRAGMLTMDENVMIAPTVTGQIMAKFYVDYETMKLLTQITGKEVMTQIIALISKCHEFSEMCIRSGDKKCLNLLNKNAKMQSIRFPLNGKIKTLDMKVNCIIQAVMGNLDIYDQSILCDSIRIMRTAERISRCLIEYLETRSNCYSALLNTIILAKCFHAKLWENSQYVSKQLPGIGNVMSNQLANAGKTSFSRILETNPREIEMILKRKAPVGNTLIEKVKYLPQYKMSLEKSSENQDELIITLTLTNTSDLEEKSTINVQSTMTLLVGENNNNIILLYEKYMHSYLIQNPHIVKKINIKNLQTDQVCANFISDDWVGIDCNCDVTITKLTEQNNRNETVKHIEKKNPTYMQMYLDMYMKSKKKPIQEGSQNEKKSTSKPQNDIKKGRKSETMASTNKKTPKKNAKTKLPTIKIANTLFGNNFIKTVKPKLKTHKSQEIIKNKESTLECTKEFENSSVTLQKNAEKDIENEKLTTQNINEDKVIKIVTDDETSDNESNNSLFSDKLSLTIFESEMCKLMDDVQEDFKKESEKIKTSEQSLKSPLKITKVLSGDGQQVAIPEKNKIILYSADSTEQLSPILTNNNKIEKSKAPLDIMSKINFPSIEQKYNKDKLMGTNQNLNRPIVQKPKQVTPTFPVIKSTKNQPALPILEFEDILTQRSNDDNRSQRMFDKFRLAHKKFSHNPQAPDSTVRDTMTFHSGQILVPAKKPRIDDNQISDYESLQKSIKWRSPLVYSPPIKFSPKLSLEAIKEVTEESGEMQYDTGNETLETLNSASTRTTDRQTIHTPQRGPKLRSPWHPPSFPREKQPTVFPLSDKDCNDSPRHDLKDFVDCSNSFFGELLNSKPQINDNKRKYKTSTSAGDYYLSQPMHKLEQDKERNENNAPNDNLSRQNEDMNFSRVQETPSEILRRPFPEASQMYKNKNVSPKNFPRSHPESEATFDAPRYSENQLKMNRNVPFSQHYRQNVLPASELDFIDDFQPFEHQEPRSFNNSYYQREPRRILTPMPNVSRYFENGDPYTFRRPLDFVPSHYNDNFYNHPMIPTFYRPTPEFALPYPNRCYSYREMPQVSPYFDCGRPNLNETHNTNVIEPDLYKHKNSIKKINSEDILECSASQVGNYGGLGGPILRNSHNRDVNVSNMMDRGFALRNSCNMDVNTSNMMDRNFEIRHSQNINADTSNNMMTGSSELKNSHNMDFNVSNMMHRSSEFRSSHNMKDRNPKLRNSRNMDVNISNIMNRDPELRNPHNTDVNTSSMMHRSSGLRSSHNMDVNASNIINRGPELRNSHNMDVNASNIINRGPELRNSHNMDVNASNIINRGPELRNSHNMDVNLSNMINRNSELKNSRNTDNNISNMMNRNLSFNENEQNCGIQNKNNVSHSFEERLNGMIETNNNDNVEINYPQRNNYEMFEDKRNFERPCYMPQMGYSFNSLVKGPYNDKQYVMRKFLHSMDE